MVIAFAGAGTAEGLAVHYHFALEVDAFAALSADYSRPLEARQIFGLYFHFHPLFIEKNFVGELRVGFLLAGVLAKFGKHFAAGLLGTFFRAHPHPPADPQLPPTPTRFP